MLNKEMAKERYMMQTVQEQKTKTVIRMDEHITELEDKCEKLKKDNDELNRLTSQMSNRICELHKDKAQLESKLKKLKSDNVS